MTARRSNPIARDLRTPKYRPRVTERDRARAKREQERLQEAIRYTEALRYNPEDDRR